MTTLFNLRILRRCYLLAFMAPMLWSLVSTAQAAPNITCSANMGNVNLGAITPANADNASITATLSYSCTNTGDTVGYASVCLAVDGGSSTLEPRYMTGPDSSKLAFNMALSSDEIWGNRLLSGKEYQSDLITIAGSSSFTGGTLIHISLLSGHGNIEAKQGIHISNFDGQHTTLTVDTGADSSVNCLSGGQGSGGFPFIVQATVTSSCFISATSDINLGNHPAGTANITGSNHAINVACPMQMPYNIGLSPSNGRTDGAGVMSGASGNLDKIPYQLRSQSGLNGQAWGNTATANSVGNGVAGIGSGVPNSHTVYVTVPKTDVRPDTYSDIVTVTVYY